MERKIFFSLIFVLTSLFVSQEKSKADYLLVIGSYRQGPGGKPQVSGITSPSLFALPIETEKMCIEAGKKIEKEIYKPVWQFDGKWTCIKNSSK